jgi:uncharacterized membrane protein
MPGWFLPALGLLLPFMFWLCRWQEWPFWWCGVVLLLFVLPRREKEGGGRGGFSVWSVLPRALQLLAGVLVALLGLAALLRQSSLSLLYYPVLVNLMFFLIFAASLRQKQSLIERLARRLEPDLPASGVRYTRRVTQVWCLFFVLNGAIAWWSIGAGEAVWALYNGCIAYILMGLMFAGEWLIRRRVRRAAGQQERQQERAHV